MKQTNTEIAELTLEKLDRIESCLGTKPSVRKSNQSTLIEEIKSYIESLQSPQSSADSAEISQEVANRVNEILESYLTEIKATTDGTNYKVDSMTEVFKEILNRMHGAKKEPPHEEPSRPRWRDAIWNYLKQACSWPIWKNSHFWGLIVLLSVFAAATGITFYINHRRIVAETKLYWLDHTLVNDAQYGNARFHIEMFINEYGIDSTYECFSTLNHKGN